MPHTTLPAPTFATVPNTPERTILPHLERSSIYRDYLQAFETTTGLPLALRPVGSFQSPLHHSKQVNSFCTLMSANNQTCAACLRQQQRIESEAATAPCTIECIAGLTESAVPIRVGETTLGHLQTGQVLLHRPTTARFKAVARRLSELGAKLDLPRLEAAYFKTRVLSRTHYDSMVRLLAVFAQHLSSLSHQVLVQESTAEPPAIARARAYIAEHRKDEIALTDVARVVNMSPFYFCKLFKRATGFTFTDYLAHLRVEWVKEDLLNPHRRVSEAAYEAGFQSLSQFNRVFRRIAGEAPSAYRTRIHGSTHASTSALPHAA